MQMQATIAGICELKGKGLHLGLPVTVRLIPSSVNTGFVFRIIKGDKKSDVPAIISNIHEKILRTAVANDGVVVETVEHILAAAYGLGLTNLIIEMDNSEPPAFDGSAREMCRRIQEAGIEEQSEPRKVYVVKETISVMSADGVYISIFPCKKGMKISYTLSGEGLPDQYLEYEHSKEAFLETIAPARTFVREFEVPQLEKMEEVGDGATGDNTILFNLENVDQKQNFKSELVSHKILDLMGDLCLFGQDIQGHLVCHKSGHSSNHMLLKKLKRKRGEGVLDIKVIQEILPHSYPFLLVDKILEIEDGVKVVGLKNVTANEPFFQGHFRGEPIMPGVLIIEALAQTGAIFIYKNRGKDKLVLFTGVDKVKFRYRVIPGDQLILEVVAKNIKKNVGIVKGVATVNGEIACEAEIKFMTVDR